MEKDNATCDPYECADFDNQHSLPQNPTTFKVILIIQVPKISGGCITGFQAAKWFCYHIDDMMDNLSIGNLLEYRDKSLSKLFTEAISTQSTHQNYSITLMKIIKSIVYVSCSKVNDTQSRSIQRIEILINLLRNNNTFCMILLSHIARLQGDRETALSTEEISKSWLFKEAAKLSNVIKYGTLKSSCVSYIEHRLGHLFAGIIAFIDTNNNLDLLVGTEANNYEWVNKFWLEMFEDEDFMNFNYQKIFLQTSNSSEKNEFICLNITGSSSRNGFGSLKLPFSWSIKQFLDQLVLIKVKEVCSFEFEFKVKS